MTIVGTVHLKPNLWLYVWKLLRLRIVILISGFRRAKLRRKIGMVFLGLLFLGFLGFIFFISWMLLKFLQSPDLVQFIGNMLPLLEIVPTLILGGAFLGILITSFGVLLQALYLAGDMDFLLSAPIPIRSVFIAKLLQAILPNFSLICLFSLPVLYGLGVANHYNILYYPLVLAILIALALAAAGISGLLVMLVVRIFPARRVAEVLGFVGAILSFLCSQSGQLARFSQFSQDQATQALGMVSHINQPWSPITWAGRGLVDLGVGRWSTAAAYLILTLGLAGVIFYGALITAERLYYSGWASMQGVMRKKKVVRVTQPSRPAITRTLTTPIARLVPPAVRAILKKDFLVLRRDLRNMSQLVTPLIIGIIYAFMFIRSGGEPPPGRGDAPTWMMDIMRNIMVYGNVGLSLFVGWMLLGRLAGMGFSQEGKQYWIIKTAPVSVTKLIVSKYLVAFLPVLGLGWIFLIGISLLQHVSVSLLLFSIPVVALSIAGNAGINLTFGIVGANMAWEDPRHMQKSGSGCLGGLAVMVYLPISLLLFFGPPIAAKALEAPEVVGQITGLVVGGVFSLACAIIPLWLVRNRVIRLGEA
jgi:ABC-2 type transport system permease protein